MTARSGRFRPSEAVSLLPAVVVARPGGDDPAHQFDEQPAFAFGKAGERCGVFRRRGLDRRAAQLARMLRQPHPLIPGGFLILIPALTAAGVSGALLAKDRRGPVAGRKRKRMPFIAAKGVLILIPAALYLSRKAQAGAFDGGFLAAQAAELIAGAVNIALLGLNMRDRMRLAGRRPSQPTPSE